MKYMLIMRSTQEAVDAFQEVDFEEVIAAMGAYNESLIKAGVLLGGEGLAGVEEGFVVDFDATPPVVTDGPYAEAKEVIGGWAIIKVDSEEEARAEGQKMADLHQTHWPEWEGAIEIRRIAEPDEAPTGT
jgi:hypothetical protein